MRETFVAASRLDRRSDGADVLDLAEIRPGDQMLVGAKAYNLGLLLQAGFPVANGFCITTNAFQKFGMHLHEASLASGPLREVILGAYRKAGIKTAAVRSSATEEDRPDASWAGVFSSILRVTGEQKLIEAVEICFRSLHGPVASLYRHFRGDRGKGAPAMAVVVQELVDADAAGILFTVNPLTRSPSEFHINAVLGLGEPLVSGGVTGDSFVATPEGVVISQAISEKSVMLTQTGEFQIPPDARCRPALDPGQIAELVRLGCAIQDFFGCPQDIEYAVGGGRIYILQARPVPEIKDPGCTREEEIETYIRLERVRLRNRITTLRSDGKLQGSEVIFSNGNVGELLPNPTPMSFGLFRHIFASRNGGIVAGRRQLGYLLPDDATETLFELICGHPYFNVEIDAATFDIGVPVDLQGYLKRIAENPMRANYPEVGLYQQCLTRSEAVSRFGPVVGERHYRTAATFRERIADYAYNFLRRFVAEIEPALSENLKPALDAGQARMSAEALVQDVYARMHHLKHVSCVHFVIAARIGFFFADMTRLRLLDLLGEAGEKLCSKLLQGLQGSWITQQMIDLEQVAAGHLSREAFLHRYGHLAANELEISIPRMSENPDSVEHMLQELAASGRRPADEFRLQIEHRKVVETKLRQRLQHSGKAASEVDALFADLQIAQSFLPLRETIKYFYAAEYARIRPALLHLARRAGLEAGDIFYLYPEELPECLGPQAAVVEKVWLRRNERSLATMLAREKRLPPVIFASRLDAIGKRPVLENSRVLVGSAVAPGIAVGVVRIVDFDSADISNSEVELTGDWILVARSANLGLAPLLRTVAGLIIEVGGILSHGACQAREAGIPAVVVENAMVLVRDGVMVKVDGDSGTVTLMDEQAR
ncbi:MAG: PEP/pyruvate-binding domain-containing protein [Pseudomonadota bacterium]